MEEIVYPEARAKNKGAAQDEWARRQVVQTLDTPQTTGSPGIPPSPAKDMAAELALLELRGAAPRAYLVYHSATSAAMGSSRVTCVALIR